MWTPSSAPMLNSRDTCRRPQVGIAAGGEAVEAVVEVVVEVVVAVVATRQVATKRQAHSRAHNQQAVARRSQAPPALPAAKDPAEADGARTTGPACKEAGPATRAKRAVLRVAMVAGATEAVVVEVVAVATEAVVAVVVAVVPVVAGGRDVVGLPKCSEPQTNSSRQLPVCFDRAFRCHGRTHFVGQRVAAH